MKKKLLSFVLLVLFLVSCSKVPITKRKQINLLPESEMMSMSLTSYREFLSQHPPVNGSSEAGMVKNVGAKISASVTRYMNQNGYAKRVQGYQWEFNLVNSNEANAWCMPGGKVVVYSGLLPITQDESSLSLIHISEPTRPY